MKSRLELDRFISITLLSKVIFNDPRRMLEKRVDTIDSWRSSINVLYLPWEISHKSFKLVHLAKIGW